MQQNLATNSYSDSVNMILQSSAMKNCLLFVWDHQTSFFVCFRGGPASVLDSYPAGNLGLYVTNYTILVKRPFRSSNSPQNIPPLKGHQDVVWQKRWAFHPNIHGLFVSLIKICQMIWNKFSETNKQKTKKIWDGKNICSQHWKRREKDRCWLSRKKER